MKKSIGYLIIASLFTLLMYGWACTSGEQHCNLTGVILAFLIFSISIAMGYGLMTLIFWLFED